MDQNIVLIGFMGTGKTEVGKLLARMLDRDFYDSDTEIERIAGLSVSQIFRKHGEGFFRQIEKHVVRELSLKERAVIATGGGVVLDRENISLLKKNGIIVCLQAGPDVICRRVKDQQNRPLLQEGDLLEKINGLLTARQELYRCADYYIDTGDKTAAEAAQEVISLLKGREKLC